MRFFRIFLTLIVLTQTLRAQMTVTATVDHVIPDGVDMQGNIYLSVTGGTSPYTYKWTPGGSTSQNKTSASQDFFTVRVKDNMGDSIFYYYNLGYKINWSDVYISTFRNDSVLYGAVVSKNTLRANTDGYFELVVGSDADAVIIGFLDSLTSYGRVSDIDAGVYISANAFYLAQQGYYYWLGYCDIGDVINVSRTGNTLDFKKNNSSVFSYTISNATKDVDWKVKTEVFAGYVSNVGCSFSDSTNSVFANYVRDIPNIVHATPGYTNGAISLTPKDGSSHNYTWTPGSYTTSAISNKDVGVYHAKIKDSNGNSSQYDYDIGYKIHWTDYYGTNSRNDSLFPETPYSVTGWGTSESYNTLRPDSNGWIEYVIKSVSGYNMIGFTDSISSISGIYNDIDFGLYQFQNEFNFVGEGTLWWAGQFFQLGDVVRIEKVDTLFNYFVNGVIFSSQTIPQELRHRTWKVKAAIYGSPIVNVGASFYDSTEVAFPNFIKDYVSIIHASNPEMNDGSLSVKKLSGTLKHSYNWIPYGDTTTYINNLPLGTYGLDIKDEWLNNSIHKYDIGYKVEWTDTTGVTLASDTIYGYSGWGTASSINKLHSSQDGWIEFVVDTLDTYRIIGFIDSTSVPGDWTDIDYGFYQYLNSLYYVGGGTYSFAGACDKGDILKIEKNDTIINWKVNDNIVGSCTISSVNREKDLKIKTATYPTDYFANVGCNFTKPLNELAIVKDHADYEHPENGTLRCISIGGIRPLNIKIRNDLNFVDSSFVVDNLRPGTYTVTVKDADEDSIRRVLRIGIKPNWKSVENAFYTNDSIALLYQDSLMGRIVANNTIKSDVEGWMEFKVNRINQDISFGFLGNEFANMDTSYTPALYPSGYLTSRLDSATSLYNKALSNNLTYSSHQLSLAAFYGLVHMVRLDSGLIQPLFKNSDDTLFTYSVGDVLRIGRGTNGYVYLTRNDTLLVSETFTTTNQFFRTAVLAKTNGFINKIGILSNDSVYISSGARLTSFCPNDKYRNWMVERSYDEYGNVVEEVKQYFDNLGRSTQTQVKDFTDANVNASESIYDALGRSIGQTLPAPLFNSSFCYNSLFFTNSSNAQYTIDDFDKQITSSNYSGEVNNPGSVGNSTQGSLGWYYSDNNSADDFVAKSAIPYNRVEYAADPLSRLVRNAGVGIHHKMGTGHEDKIYYMRSNAELLFVYPNNTYELDETFKPKFYGSIPNITSIILDAHKTVKINADGHDQISYTNSKGQLLATCVSGYDNACTGITNPHQITKDIFALYHVTKQKNATLKFSATTSLSNIEPLITNYTTKVALVKNTDFTYNTSTGYITFLGDFANMDLFLDISYTYATGFSGPATVYESHEISYTQWTVYYYDVKGRIKAIQSPNDVVCGQTPGGMIKRITTSSLAFSCDTTEVIHTVSLSTASTTAVSDSVHSVILSLRPTVNTFTALTTYTTASRFRFQSNDTIAPRDTMYFRDTSILLDTVVVNDTMITPLYFYNDTTLQNTDTDVRSDIKDLLMGKSIRYTGKYIVGIKNLSVVTTFLPDSLFPFDYTIETDSAEARVRSNLLEKDLTIYLPDSLLTNGDEIDIKCADLRIQISGFTDAPVNPFSPCDTSLFAATLAADLLTNINANIGLTSRAIMNTNPPPTAPASFTRKYWYNEYDHLVGYQTKDEGKTDYLYDVKEDKFLFSQNDKQRANGAKFSYSTYDALGRLTETGEYDPTVSTSGTPLYFETYADIKASTTPPGGVDPLRNYIDGSALAGGLRRKSQTFLSYDFADGSLTTALPAYEQKYTYGKLSRVIYDYKHTIWYSYDEMGRVIANIQDINGLGLKTMNYNYDIRGKMSTSDYQRTSADRFVQTYYYDKDERLSRAVMHRNFSSSYSPPVANFSYYLHGPLKRVELGNKLQGLDYVYTINGLLKSVNNPVPSSDPGNDGVSSGCSADMFSYALEYYPYDYERTGSPLNNIKSNGYYGNLNISYSGLISSIRWKTTRPASAPALSPNITGQQMYEYNYDELYRLKGCAFGEGVVISNAVSLNNYNSFKQENITYDKNGNIQTLKRYSDAGTATVMDELTYNYNGTANNRLEYISDANTTSLGYGSDIDIQSQSSGNYVYDEIGQMITNTQDNQKYEYDFNGHVTRVKTSSNVPVIDLEYNALGLRQIKTAYSGGTAINKTYYSYDAAGNLIATYDKDLTVITPVVTLTDFNLYAGARVGTYNEANNKPYFELTDHLGSVRAVITDNSGSAQAVNYTDYYPHGSVMPGHKYVTTLGKRYGFQGQENDAETGLVNFELRQYDARIGRWLNVDPMSQYHSPYLAMANNPINNIDPNGGWDVSSNFGGDYMNNMCDPIILPFDVPTGNPYASNERQSAEQFEKFADLRSGTDDKGMYNKDVIKSNVLADERANFENLMSSRQETSFNKSYTSENNFVNLDFTLSTAVVTYGTSIPSTNTAKNFTGGWLNSNFIGPGPAADPYHLKDNNGNLVRPKDAIDAAAQKHDYYYYKAKVDGVSGALLSMRVLEADLLLLKTAELIMFGYQYGAKDPVTRDPISLTTYLKAVLVKDVFKAVTDGKMGTYTKNTPMLDVPNIARPDKPDNKISPTPLKP
jgi:RHS repeat-associated protein